MTKPQCTSDCHCAHDELNTEASFTWTGERQHRSVSTVPSSILLRGKLTGTHKHRKKKKVLTLFPHTHRTLHNIPNIHQIVQQKWLTMLQTLATKQDCARIQARDTLCLRPWHEWRERASCQISLEDALDPALLSRKADPEMWISSNKCWLLALAWPAGILLYT